VLKKEPIYKHFDSGVKVGFEVLFFERGGCLRYVSCCSNQVLYFLFGCIGIIVIQGVE